MDFVDKLKGYIVDKNLSMNKSEKYSFKLFNF